MKMYIYIYVYSFKIYVQNIVSMFFVGGGERTPWVWYNQGFLVVVMLNEQIHRLPTSTTIPTLKLFISTFDDKGSGIILLMLQKSGIHSPVDGLVVYLIIYRVLAPSQVVGVPWDFWTINRIGVRIDQQQVPSSRFLQEKYFNKEKKEVSALPILSFAVQIRFGGWKGGKDMVKPRHIYLSVFSPPLLEN